MNAPHNITGGGTARAKAVMELSEQWLDAFEDDPMLGLSAGCALDAVDRMPAGSTVGRSITPGGFFLYRDHVVHPSVVLRG